MSETLKKRELLDALNARSENAAVAFAFGQMVGRILSGEFDAAPATDEPPIDKHGYDIGYADGFVAGQNSAPAFCPYPKDKRDCFTCDCWKPRPKGDA